MRGAYHQFLEFMVERITMFLDSKLTNASTKLEPKLVVGYLTTLLHSASCGFALDPPSSEKITLIQQNSLPEANKGVLKEAIQWLVKNVETVVKNVPMKKTEMKVQEKKMEVKT